MKILVCNDDGIEAPGLALLESAARGLSEDVWTVAPDAKRTAAGPSLTIARPLTMRCICPRWYSCSGTPADCVVTAMTWLFDGQEKPDLVLSGINDGRNVAEDLAYSGTLGIAREAAFWGIPAIGFSRVKSPDTGSGDVDWLTTTIASLWSSHANWALEGHWLSINLPTRLPASFRQPRIGRDKIGRRAEIIEHDGDRTVITVPRGRDNATTPGDENDAIDSGFATVNRLNWFGETPFSETSLKQSQFGLAWDN